MNDRLQQSLRRHMHVFEIPVFRALADCCADFIAVLDRDGQVIYVSPAITQVAGYLPDEVIGRKLSDFIHPDDQAIAQRCFLTSSAKPVRVTHRYRHKNGSWLLIDTLTRNALHDPDIGGILVNTRDVTGQRRAEDSLTRVSRALDAFAAVSTARIHAVSEVDLLAEVCRIMVESAGYRMAWVGYADHDADKDVRPVAQFGYESGYLAGAHITWDESERGRGPTGMAIRKGITQVNQSTLTNPRMQPWWQDALKRGFASSAAIPLKSGNSVFGALTIYAPESDAFDRDELKLLEQLAAELTDGIAALRVREALKREVAE
jgi:PAS domain S-box-containing protein